MNPKFIKYLGTILLGAVQTPEDDRIICQNNNSLFILIGNPGMIWHPLSGQCVSIKEIEYNSGWINTDDSSELFMSKSYKSARYFYSYIFLLFYSSSYVQNIDHNLSM
jgi:hypothetical protein